MIRTQASILALAVVIGTASCASARRYYIDGPRADLSRAADGGFEGRRMGKAIVGNDASRPRVTVMIPREGEKVIYVDRVSVEGGSELDVPTFLASRRPDEAVGYVETTRTCSTVGGFLGFLLPTSIGALAGVVTGWEKYYGGMYVLAGLALGGLIGAVLGIPGGAIIGSEQCDRAYTAVTVVSPRIDGNKAPSPMHHVGPSKPTFNTCFEGCLKVNPTCETEASSAKCREECAEGCRE